MPTKIPRTQSDLRKERDKLWKEYELLQLRIQIVLGGVSRVFTDNYFEPSRIRTAYEHLTDELPVLLDAIDRTETQLKTIRPVIRRNTKLRVSNKDKQ